MGTPAVSVIIPTYNRSQYVTEAIGSVLAQTFTDYEIIVIDDGSTDNTREAILPYFSKITYIYQENRGVSAARNTGIREAKGEWIAFLDSDDEWLPSKLELQVKDLQQFPDAVLSCTNIVFEGGAGSQSIDYFETCLSVNFNRTEFIQDALFKSYAFTSTVLARRKDILIVGMFDEHMSIYEDIDLFFRLSTQGGFVVNPLVLAKAFRRDEYGEINLSGQFLSEKEKNYKNIINIYKKLANFRLTPQQKYFVREKLSNSWFDLGIVYQDLKLCSQGRHCFLASFCAHPSWKSFVKFLLGLSGTIGVNHIKKGRETKKGFRRSEYYQNDSKQ